MNRIDYREVYSEVYRDGTAQPAAVHVPPLRCLAVMAVTGPLPDARFDRAAESLQALDRAMRRLLSEPPMRLEFQAMPLEACWPGPGEGEPMLMVMQPPVVDADRLESAAHRVDDEDLGAVELVTLPECRALHVLHHGDDLAAGFERLREAAEAAGQRPGPGRHAIYLDDPRHTTGERLRSVLRIPITAAE